MINAAVIAAVLLFVSPLRALAADTPAPPFERDGAVKLLGYDPEAPADLCKTNTHSIAAAVVSDAKNDEGKAASYLAAAGEIGAERIACPNRAAEVLEPFARPGDKLAALVCVAAATAAGDKLTVHVSELMNSEHPDIVAAYADGVAQALQSIRDACIAQKEIWAKVATQSLLFEDRATSLRQVRVCTLWRMALDKELKSATALGQSNGKAAGLAHFDRQVGAARAGAHHHCGDDAAAGLVEANIGLTKMLLDTMPEK